MHSYTVVGPLKKKENKEKASESLQLSHVLTWLIVFWKMIKFVLGTSYYYRLYTGIYGKDEAYEEPVLTSYLITPVRVISVTWAI